MPNRPTEVLAMTTAHGTQPVWAFTEHEHRDLTRGLNRIHEVGCEIGSSPRPELSAHLIEVLGWLERTLEPHVAWEETWLYPEIESRTGTAWSTRAARYDHRQIRDAVMLLREDRLRLILKGGVEAQAQIRCRLFGLEALLRAHIEREERLLIPILAEERAPAPA